MYAEMHFVLHILFPLLLSDFSQTVILLSDKVNIRFRMFAWLLGLKKKALLKLYSSLLTICTACFNNNKLCVSLTDCIYLLYVILAINSGVYHVTSLIGWSL